MKHSVAKKITHWVSVSLLIGLAVLLVASFFMVDRIVFNKYEKVARSVVTVFADMVSYIADCNDTPVDVDHTEIPIFVGEYICRWYDIDYAYLFYPDEDTDALTYICVMTDPEKGNPPVDNHGIGAVRHETLTQDVIDVWNGDSLLASRKIKSDEAYYFSTFVRMEDAFGHRYIAGADILYDRIYSQIIGFYVMIALICLIVIFGIGFTVYLTVRRLVTKPARKISRVMQEFISNGERSAVSLPVSGDNEFSMIAESFNSMSGDINAYLDNIHTLTRTQEHQQAQLDIAARIQRGFLPADHAQGLTYTLNAVMQPARDIGGDLYDHVTLDENRLLTVIADVSGKGISASLFMAVTLMLIRLYAKDNLPPDEILRRANVTLSENNAEMLFATAFVGIYDARDTTLTYANAGHNPPYIIGKEFRLLDQPSGTVLGLFPDETYQKNTVSLCAGDTLFLYTDGVTESTDPSRRFFGTERLEEVLCDAHRTGSEPIPAVLEAIRAFAAGAEQYDDITALSLTVRQTVSLSLLPRLSELERIRDAILSYPADREIQLSLCLAAEEWFVNICTHAYPSGAPEQERILFELTGKERISMSFTDGGIPFNPLENTAAPDDYDVDTRIGGLGNFLAFSSMDGVRYTYENGKNKLTFIKKNQEVLS